MTRHGTLLGTVAGCVLLLAAAVVRAQTCPPECPAPGEPIKPDKKQGCFVEFGGVPEASNGFKVNCEDGDSDCDTGTTADQCQFPIRVCINNVDPRFPNCTPEGIASIGLKKVKGVQTDEVAALNETIAELLAADPNSNACTDAVSITVRLKRKGNKLKKAKALIKTETTGLGGKTANDKLQLTCLPPAAPPPSCPVNPNGGPNRLTQIVGPGADRDTGWTGISHNQGVVEGSRVFLCLRDCDQSTNPVCTGIGETDSNDKSNTINGKFFGAPLPLSTGGVPVCVVNEYRDDIILAKYDLSTSETEQTVLLTSKVHQGIKIDQPCPICKGSAVFGAGGSCDGGPGYAGNGKACTVEGLTQFGNTSTKCLPDPANGIGNLTIDLPLTTESGLLPGDTFSCIPPPQGSGGQCPCAQQKQRNDCDSACSSETPPCPSGLEPGVDQKCCVKSGQGRGCFEGDIPTQGLRGIPTPAWPDPTYPKMADNAALSTPFCIAATESVIVNNVAGLSGPGNLILPGPSLVALTRCVGGSNEGEPCGSDVPCDGGTCQ